MLWTLYRRCLVHKCKSVSFRVARPESYLNSTASIQVQILLSSPVFKALLDHHNLLCGMKVWSLPKLTIPARVNCDLPCYTASLQFRWLAQPLPHGLFVGEILVFLLFRGKLTKRANHGMRQDAVSPVDWIKDKSTIVTECI